MRRPSSFGKLGNRGLARLVVGLEATLALPQRTARGAVENVSRHGCCLRLAGPPRIGATVLVRIERIETMGSVVWADSERCGIRFERLLTAAAVERLRWIVDHSAEYTRSGVANAPGAWR